MTSTTPFHTAVRVDFYYLTIELRYEHEKKKFIHSNVEKVIIAEFFPQTLLTNSKMTLLGTIKKPLMISSVELNLEWKQYYDT